MKRITIIILCFMFSLSLFAQRENYSIEYETHKVGVFNPEWEINQSLNPRKYEHITGFFREELAKTILKAVKEKKVRIYDIRKHELSVDSVINNIIKFEKAKFNVTLGKDSVLDYIIPYISAYDFEEAVTYNYKDLSIEKKVTAYCPYLVHYRQFNDTPEDSVQLPLFWIFPKDTVVMNGKNKVEPTTMEIPDTVLSVLQLKYPVKMPFSSSIFENVQGKKIKVFHSDGSEFKTPKEIDDLFVIVKKADYYNEETGKDSLITAYSDIMPEDIAAVRIAENWGIKIPSMEIVKKVQYFLPLYAVDDETFAQLGVRIWNKPQKN